MKRGRLIIVGVVLLCAAAFAWFGASWWASANLPEDRAFLVDNGSSLTTVANKLEREGIIGSADAFLLRAKVLGSGDPIKAGEFMLPAGSSSAKILDTFQHGEVIRRFVTVPEGLPSIMVWERLMAEPLLTGEIPVPAEGSVLPESYDFERGESRAAVLARMQQAMQKMLSTAPAPPSKWPMADLVLLIETVEMASPNSRRTAPSSSSSPSGVEVPWAMM